MAISLATIETRVKTKIRADLATPVVNDLDDASILTWANERKSEVIHLLKDPVRFFPSLHVSNTSLTFSSGSASLPASYELYQNVTVNSGGVSERKCRVYTDPKDFKLFDSSNFILTPDTDRPFVLITDKIYVKPTSITSGKIDYIKIHPAISGSQSTVFTEIGDLILVLLIAQEYYRSVPQRFDLAQNIDNEIARILNANNIPES